MVQDDNGVVYQHTQPKRQARQGKYVQGYAQGVKAHKGEQQRYGYAEPHQQRRGIVALKKEEHPCREQAT